MEPIAVSKLYFIEIHNYITGYYMGICNTYRYGRQYIDTISMYYDTILHQANIDIREVCLLNHQYHVCTSKCQNL